MGVAPDLAPMIAEIVGDSTIKVTIYVYLSQIFR